MARKQTIKARAQDEPLDRGVCGEEDRRLAPEQPGRVAYRATKET